ncbi:hypothetical protein GA830_08770 [Mesorhizobium sp. NBSH29]|uniref:hypothetical protein n=1 Tax=Mesorhizobium sp. NBSH29 TaxID=2654249 RepID=UPI0018967650|nr:hypothetical protein [Mesorhizobium sp. NBSH29]QPC86819.1 hypothetical protein GA830_08770 [Mesorhizobium sp. NBSH29]
MKHIVATAILLLASLTSATAHTVTLPDGTEWVHDENASYFAGGPVRNVSVTAPQVTDCAKATWPDIPAACLITDSQDMGNNPQG